MDGDGVVELAVGIGADRVLWVRLDAPADGGVAVLGPFGAGGAPEVAWLYPYPVAQVQPEPDRLADAGGSPGTGRA
jgi:hypothetical protein